MIVIQLQHNNEFDIDNVQEAWPLFDLDKFLFIASFLKISALVTALGNKKSR